MNKGDLGIGVTIIISNEWLVNGYVRQMYAYDWYLHDNPVFTQAVVNSKST